jgi:hypothetical protein
VTTEKEIRKMSILKMEISKNKTAAIAIATLLIISMGTSVVLIPSASAHTPSWQIPTTAYIAAEPNPVGVNQQILIYFWINLIFGGQSTSTNGAAQLTNNYRFHNYNLTIVSPNGTATTTIFDVNSDPTSSHYTSFTPAEVGTYTLIFTFPGQNYTQYNYDPSSPFVGDTYLPSTKTSTLIVQQEPLPSPQGSPPLPTDYWTRPIYGENTDWWLISSNWLGTGSPVSSATGSGYISAFSFAPGFGWGSDIERYPGDAVGPLTGHVMWTHPLENGGVVGGNNVFGDIGASDKGITWFEGSAYEQRYVNPIIVNGIIYYTEPVTFTGTTAGPTVAQDLRTGKIIWKTTQIPALSFAYTYNLWNPDQHGVYPAILFTNNFARAFDAYTGLPLFNVTGVPTGFPAQGPAGEQLRYNIARQSTTWYLSEWNSSRLWANVNDPFLPPNSANILAPTLYNMSFTNGTALTAAQAQQATITQPAIGATAGKNIDQPATSNYLVYANVVNPNSTLYSYDWNYSIPAFNAMTVAPTELLATGNVLLFMTGIYPALPQPFYTSSWAPYTYYAININASRGTIGSLLWTKTLQQPPENRTVFYAGVDPTAPDGLGNLGVFAEVWKETSQFIGYSLTTGDQIWGPTEPQVDIDYYGQPGPAQPDAQEAYGMLYSSSFGGILYAYNMTTGKIEWTYGNGGEGNSTRSLSTPYGAYPTFINAVGNGVIYLVTTEHTATNPIYKGALARAVNATTGQEIWTLSSYTSEFVSMSYAIADGYATWFNSYDNQIYSIGRGPSALTVSAPDLAAASGQAVVIRGTVTDVSAGTQQPEQIARFQNGVPVSSDASMKDWMGYVYQQKPLPTDFKGVPVTVDVLDSNGNFRNIGTATTDATGMYSLTWTPDISGNYTVVATFHGTNGYWPSWSETSFAVMNAPTLTAAPTAPPAVMTDTYVLGSAIAIIVVIIIIGAVLIALMMRKRP